MAKQNLKFYKGSVAPVSPATGTIFFNTTTRVISVYTGSAWENYGGITEASVTGNVLTIKNAAGGKSVEIDFSDFASAGKVLEVFNTIKTNLDKKVDAVDGKQLSDENYTSDEKSKLRGIATGAQVNVIEEVQVNGQKVTPNNKSVNIIVPAATVTGVKSGDKVLDLSGTELTSTLSLKYDKNRISLTGIGGTEIAGFDASDFVKDSYLSDVKYNDSTHDLTFTFNTEDNGAEEIVVNLEKLVDVYKNGTGLTLTNGTFAVDANYVNGLITAKISDLNKSDSVAEKQFVTAVSETNGIINVSRRGLEAADIPELEATNVVLSDNYKTATIYEALAPDDSVEEAISKLEKGIVDAKAAGVTSFQNATGDITVDTAGTGNGTVKFAMSGKQLTASVPSLKGAAFVETSAFDAAGTATTAVATAKSELIGSNTNNADNNTIWGAKKYAESLASNYATNDQGTKADSALQSVSASGANKYVTAAAAAKADNAQAITVTAVIGKVSDNTDALATAADVKSYVDTTVAAAMMWEDFA